MGIPYSKNSLSLLMVSKDSIERYGALKKKNADGRLRFEGVAVSQ
jgi:hypothetical protein